MPCTDTAAGELGSHQSRLGPRDRNRRRGSGHPPASDAGVPGRSTWHRRSVPRGGPDPVPPYWRVLAQGGRLAPSPPTITEAPQARYPDLLSPPRNPIRATLVCFSLLLLLGMAAPSRGCPSRMARGGLVNGIAAHRRASCDSGTVPGG